MLDARTLSLLMLSFGSMSNKKLQKMCYYMYSWYLAIFKERVANVQFEAWVHGPVCRDIYNMYKRYGWEDIPSYIGFIPVEEEVKACPLVGRWLEIDNHDDLAAAEKLFSN